MDRIQDPRLLEILETRQCQGLTAETAHADYRLARLLLACRAWEDIDVFTPVAALPDGRYVAPVGGKWGIVFSWSPGSGPRGLHLQRF